MVNSGIARYLAPLMVKITVSLSSELYHMSLVNMKVYMILSCMTPSCKVSFKTRVLDELIKMGLSKKDISLLVGPAEALIQLRGLKNIDEFISKWFDPIRKVSQEGLIDKTESVFVISEGKYFTEEPYAFLFINTQPRNLEIVQEKLQAIPKVLSADTVFGCYDVICAVKASNNKDLELLVSQIQTEVPEIKGISTAMVFSLY
jgi:DNA-binding Lrp family transcriptional regulator